MKSRVPRRAELPSIRLYRRIAIVFLSLTLLLLLVVLYLATVSATVRVETTERPVSTEFRARLAGEPQSGSDIPAIFFKEQVDETRVFEVTGEGTEIPAKAHGFVTLVNETSAAQPLVATTRLLNQDGVLFRMKTAATVPANGTVSVEVAADVAGPEGEIGPSRFTIPGLTETKQAVIYATSDTGMVGGTEVKRVVTEEDLDRAHAELVASIESDRDAVWRAGLPEALTGTLLTSSVTEKRSDTEPGTEVGTFTIGTVVDVTGVYYDRPLLERIAEAKLREHVPDGQVLREARMADLRMTVDQLNLASNAANVTVAIEGTALLKATADILDVDQLVGLTGPEVEALLEQQETIQNVEVEFFPFWVRRIPRLRDHVTVEVVDPTAP